VSATVKLILILSALLQKINTNCKNASHYDLRKFSFRSRVVTIWNSLPDSVVDAGMINTFKSPLDKHWLDQDVVHNFSSELTGSRAASICM